MAFHYDFAEKCDRAFTVTVIEGQTEKIFCGKQHHAMNAEPNLNPDNSFKRDEIPKQWWENTT